MSPPVNYTKIRRLVSDIGNETGVKRRRDHSMRLKEKLSDEYVLKQLVEEATPETSNWPEEDSIAARKSRALSSMWVSVFQAVITMVRTNMSNVKVKLAMDEVKLPLDLLAAFEKASAIMKDPSVAIPLLPRKSVRNLLEYILDSLAMDQTKPVRLDLLKGLERVCDNQEFVGFFKHPQDFEAIVGEVLRFLDTEDEAANTDMTQTAAKVLYTLTKTVRALGIEIYIFVNAILDVVTKYYAACLKDEDRVLGSQHDVHTYLFGAVTNVIYQHPDYCLTPIKKRGSKLLKAVVKFYPPSVSFVKEALNKFLLSYL